MLGSRGLGVGGVKNGGLSAHFFKCSFVPVPTSPFVPNTSHLPKVPICTKCPRVHDDLTRRRFDARTI